MKVIVLSSSGKQQKSPAAPKTLSPGRTGAIKFYVAAACCRFSSALTHASVPIPADSPMLHAACLLVCGPLLSFRPTILGNLVEVEWRQIHIHVSLVSFTGRSCGNFPEEAVAGQIQEHKLRNFFSRRGALNSVKTSRLCFRTNFTKATKATAKLALG